jgi:hypothetical protein
VGGERTPSRCVPVVHIELLTGAHDAVSDKVEEMKNSNAGFIRQLSR